MTAVFDAYLKLPKPKRILVWVVLSLLVIAVYYFVGFRPRMSSLRGLEDDYDRLGKDLRENQALAANLPKVKEEVRRLDQKLGLALEKLPNKEEIPALLRTVSDLGRDAGLEFLLFRPSPMVPKDFYAEVPLELQVLGRYHDVAVFFDRIGKLPRIVTIQDLELGSGKPGSRGLRITASCRATTFKFLEPGEKPVPKPAAKPKEGAK